ncbi:Phosphoserine phosphatase [Mesorhizobium albiziae]|uniref:Phosphoserine phosphatase n=1 Tax=Neomesorhizobium albiziae TaxID=335020 RepID=A0A1I4CCT8_9HYPH|nr:HAD family hydrolase [Mesorhizobium albiziae]GLS29526.1 haloacid dehalogenase [Mesorhizobium albiziae]SFK78089.1 Phosphoserine phosphatase [Mesorhizobium albiziae]
MILSRTSSLQAFLSIPLLLLALVSVAVAQTDPLPSWKDGPVKSAITDFVAKVTQDGGADFVPPEERIAVFDNDGTLWSEQPVYFQLAFALDRIKAMAPQHPEWNDTEPFKSVLAGDTKGLAAAGEKGLMEIMALTHSGMTTDEYAAIVADWLKTARHPRFDRPYDELVYQPQLELLAYLRANGFKTFIVSGGGVEFMRGFAEKAYGIPPEQVVGSAGVTKFELRDGVPVLVKESKIEFIDDGPGKPSGINNFIGRRPIFAFGNSDGDQQMLEWTAAGPGARFIGIVHHTDADREWAYDRQSHIGKLDKALDEGTAKGWTIVDMKNDWLTVYPPAK